MKYIFFAAIFLAWIPVAFAASSEDPIQRHPAAVAYTDAINLLSKDPKAAHERAKEAMDLLDKKTAKSDRIEIELLMRLAHLKQDPDSRRRASALRKTLAAQKKANLPITVMAARSWMAMAGNAYLREDWEGLLKFGAQAENAMKTVAPGMIDAQTIAITYQGIGILHQPVKHGRRFTSIWKHPDPKSMKVKFEHAIETFKRGLDLYKNQDPQLDQGERKLSLSAWKYSTESLYRSYDNEAAQHYFDSVSKPEGKSETENMKSTQCDVTPQTRKSPAYPKKAAQKGLFGVAIVEFDLNSDGHPQNVRALIGVPSVIFGTEAVKAIEKWRYDVPLNTTKDCLKGYRVQIDYTLEDA